MKERQNTTAELQCISNQLEEYQNRRDTIALYPKIEISTEFLLEIHHLAGSNTEKMVKIVGRMIQYILNNPESDPTLSRAIMIALQAISIEEASDE